MGRIGLGILLIIIGVALAVTQFGGFGFNGGKSSGTIDEMVEASVSGVGTIRINGVSDDVQVVNTSGDVIKVTLKGDYSSLTGYKPPTLELEDKGNKLEISVKYYAQMNISMRRRTDFTVYLPDQYKESFQVHVVSADVSIEERDLKELVVNTVSGDLTANDIMADRIAVSTTSGEAHLEDIQGELDFNTTSGDLNATFTALTGDIYVDGVSSDIRLNLPDKSGFQVDYNTVSGDFNMAHEGTIRGKKDIEAQVGGGDHMVEVSTVSGDLSIR